MKLVMLCLLLAAPAFSSPEQLVGTWESRSVDEEGAGETVFRMTLSEDGRVEMDLVFAFAENLWNLVLIVYEEALGGAKPELPPLETIDIRAAGTWEATADSFWVDSVEEAAVTVNGDQDPVRYFTGVGRILARAIADAQGVSETDYPDFENAFVEEFQSDFVASFFDLEGELFVNEVISKEAYDVEGDRLRLTVDGETTEFQRVDDDRTAVTPTSWGRVKRQMR